MQLSLELFVETPEKSLDFYQRVLGFEVQGSASAEYTMLKNDDAVIAINSRSVLSSDHPFRLVDPDGYYIRVTSRHSS
ncbi:hypothetical protein ELH27_37155 [Rhizobium leguminosarum]|uniref:Glyoxalase/fosfomycin resistance/dioxygenase domain-containing protein n=1 Tax=Rhizobium beringeri TaxID=3019934 RepID=A0ABY1XH10_9HYPH|nr:MULTISPECIES: VOC family protein [Rhizobium]TAU34883.1 hypothetical protein ELI43_37690 [Rhizobium leguminosarum]TBC53756.1 hypothetical protein ELH27_37155 [Rhizobium leguminosarum]TBE57812.1 hypothetical protein ELH03_36105 [Rhizobium beringeri]